MVPDDALTVQDVAGQLRVKPVTVRSWITEGRLKAQRASASPQARWWVYPQDLQAMLAERNNVEPLDEEAEAYEAGPDEPALGLLNSLGLDEHPGASP